MKTALRGFTLIELMVVVAVLAILATVAVPGMRDFVQQNRLAAQSNELVGSFALARSEALKRGAPVSVCRSADGASCTGNWQDGWIVFADSAAPGAAPAVDELVRVTSELSGTTALNGPAYIRYLPSGRLEQSGTQQFTLSAADCADGDARLIQVLSTGRAGVSRTACP